MYLGLYITDTNIKKSYKYATHFAVLRIKSILKYAVCLRKPYFLTFIFFIFFGVLSISFHGHDITSGHSKNAVIKLSYKI